MQTKNSEQLSRLLNGIVTVTSEWDCEKVSCLDCNVNWDSTCTIIIVCGKVNVVY